jgi:hypothetical protein
MNAQIQFYNAVKLERKAVIRHNASCRIKGRKDLVQEVPVLPKKPSKYLLEDFDGTYIGTEFDEEFARDYAKEHKCKLTILPFDK